MLLRRIFFTSAWTYCFVNMLCFPQASRRQFYASVCHTYLQVRSSAVLAYKKVIFFRGGYMDTFLIVAAIAGGLVVAATVHSRYLHARLRHVRTRSRYKH